jgi:hypothetical protein
MRALDDVGDVTLALSYPALGPDLTSYGKALLLNQGPAKPAGGIYGQLLRGQMGGNMAVTMLLNKESDNSVGGVYFYDKYRKPIKLSGWEKGDALELNEGAGADGQEKATMRLTISGQQIKGRWIGKKEFAVELTP